ncbi:hypothetical protein [Aggregatibacter kilianii]|uniref:hypothetical protein n=1 Tax=Aggregatibacter kilianii TaxID=2025884 RepID=UPI001EF84749|nr:hypothetical protein [Aggregatibacter kilianii]
MTFQEEIENFRTKNFEPFTNAVKFIEILSFAFNVTNAEAINVIEKKCKETNKSLTAIAIKDNNDYGFVDKQKSIKVFNSFTTTYGFYFSLIDITAFLDDVSVDDIFVSVNDLKSIYPVLTEILPKERCIFVDKGLFCSMNDVNPAHESTEKYLNLTELQEEKAQNTQLQEDIERLKAENAELKAQLQVQKENAVDSEPVLRNAKAYDVRERETHLLIIGALSNLLATNKPKYQKGKGVISQSAISKDIETEIIELLQPATKTRTTDTIRPRIRESLNLITKAE